MADTPGSILAAARQAQGLSPADIAKQTRLSVQAIHDIESDQYEGFGAATFVRGYLRSFARVVSVSEETIFQAWEALPSSAQLSSPAPAVISENGFAVKAPVTLQTQAPSRTLMVLGALIVLCTLVWWENHKTVSVENNTVVLTLRPTTVASAPMVAAPIPVVAQAAPIEKIVALKHKHYKVHHAANTESMHVTYTLRPVTSEASNH